MKAASQQKRTMVKDTDGGQKATRHSIVYVKMAQGQWSGFAHPSWGSNLHRFIDAKDKLQ